MQYLAQPLLLQLQPACAGTYLRWLSPLGTWPGWLFTGDSDPKTETTDATDISTADARATVAVRRAATDTLVVRAGDLSTAQHQALTTLLDSPQVYQQLADGRRIPVLVLANSSASRTSSEGRHELELTIKLPTRNALTH
ncbi:hypothetical protein QMK33_19750 [Hymenobacter sp. H14-R3]|uniref:hypothetical protein n=1 Tax=Hymenobacter sp. H14-R3 TaxID=3046308 RepID=UPI0024BAA716|nr:hypothetical protein [Hymenobacter sp. H14-R3]MDJ0367389.1 hypothetical protein [Hymenobacter sp. H14-R3]